MVTLRVVNKALIGEPEHAVLQNIETNEIFEFSQIENVNITDGDIFHQTIIDILNRGHQIEATINEGRVTLHF